MLYTNAKPTHMRWISLTFLNLVFASTFTCAQGPSQRSEADALTGQPPMEGRILFLGDSITYAGGYISCIDTALVLQHPDLHLELINAGLPSETVSGLSEPGHAGGEFPRPDLHERLTRVLEQVQPDWVIACYGMNDGIYYPLEESRFARYRSGIERLHDAVVERGAQIIHLTPAYFDALPIRDRLLPAGRDQYPQPFAGYDEVLDAYSQWLLAQRDRGWTVLDVHGAMKRAIETARKVDPAFTFAADGVHPDAAGQAIIAAPLAEAWGLQLSCSDTSDPKSIQIAGLVAQKQELLKHAWLSATGHKRPGISKGRPLIEATEAAEKIDEQARAMARSVTTRP